MTLEAEIHFKSPWSDCVPTVMGVGSAGSSADEEDNSEPADLAARSTIAKPLKAHVELKWPASADGEQVQLQPDHGIGLLLDFKS